MIINIYVYSKTLTSIKRFKNFFLYNKITDKLNIFIISFNNKKKINKFTLLKSPHVNKTAQEHFKTCFYCMQVKLFTSNLFLFLVYFKIIKSTLFTDLSIKLTFESNKLHFNKKLNTCLNPKKFMIENDVFSLNNYLNLLNFYGEISIK